MQGNTGPSAAIRQPAADSDQNRSARRVVTVAVSLVVAQIAFRAWAIFESWFQFDDFSFISRVLNNPVPQIFFEEYAGHLMPAGMALTWTNHTLSPFDWTYPAAQLLFFQALASVGCLVFLLDAFGRRWGILPPLAIYLASAITVPAVTWWAAGVNQVPLQAAIFWGAWAHLRYLRTGRLRWTVATLAITLLSLAFYEKTLTIFFIYLFVPLAYFATGNLRQRVAQVWEQYRWGVLLHGVVAAGYLALYLTHAFSSTPSSDEQERVPIATVGAEIIPRFITGLTGGPITWRQQGSIWQVPDPSTALLLVSSAAVAGVIYALARTRTAVLRGLYLPVVLLLASIILFAVSRGVLVGPGLAQDYRYQSEMSAVAALSLALMSMPLRGAVERCERVRPDRFLDSRLFVAGATAVVATLGVWSSVTYLQFWHDQNQARTYFTTAKQELEASPAPVPLVDTRVPDFISLPFSWPENSVQHMFRSFEDYTRFPSVTVDNISMIDDAGRIRPMLIEPVRRDTGAGYPCAHTVKNGRATIELDDPVIGAGWWVRLEYHSAADADVTVTGGDEHHDVTAPAGLHSIFFSASGKFTTIQIEGLPQDADACVRMVEVGFPTPYEVSEEE